MGTSLSYGGAESTETKTKKYFLTIAGPVCCRRQQWLLSQQATGDRRCVHPFDLTKKKDGMASHNIAQEKLTENAVLSPSGHGNCLLECWMIKLCRGAARRETTNEDLCLQMIQKLISSLHAKRSGKDNVSLP
jgi:hypothetical protein